MNKKSMDEGVAAYFDAVDCVRRVDMSEKFDVVRAYLAHGGDVDVRDEEGQTALFLAALNGSGKMVALLLEYGAQVNVRNDWGATPLLLAAMGGNLPAIRLLVEAGGHVNVMSDEGGDTPLQAAHIEAYLLYDEVNEQAVACVKYLEQHGAKRRIVLDCEDMPELSPLNYRFLKAVVQEDVEAVCETLAEGADVNVRGRRNVSALEQAAGYDNVKLIHALLAFVPEPECVQAAIETAECYECSRALSALV